MRTFFVCTWLFVVAMFIIPVGGMSSSNVNHEFYMYGFLGCEILCVASIIRVYFKFKRK